MALTRCLAAGAVLIWMGWLDSAWAQAGVKAQAETAYQRGLRLDLGEAVQRNPAAAFAAYSEAARAGLPAAEFNVAVMLDSGQGVETDHAAAAVWYARAAAHGHARAAYNLGLLYVAGEGVPGNPEAAAVWFGVADSLPAARRRLEGLRAITASNAPPLSSPSNLRPSEGETLPPRADPETLELVWSAPPQPVGVRYFVELMTVGTSLRPVFDTYLDRTSVLAAVGAATGRFAWRVYAVDATGGHYAASPWARFTIEPGQ